MTRADILAFARRDWAAVEAAKVEEWARQKELLSAERLLSLADGLRSGVVRMRPDWPSAAEREADLAAHVELSRQLGAVRVRSAP